MLVRIIGLYRWLSLLFRPKTIFVRRFSPAFGDNLLMSVVLPRLRKRHPHHTIVVESNRPELFYHNPFADIVTSHFVFGLITWRHFTPRYAFDKRVTTHLIDQLLAPYGAADNPTRGAIGPEIHLTDEEREIAASLFETPFVALCHNAKTSWAANRKKWGLENFQALVDIFVRENKRVVQIGVPGDTLLHGVIDGRGLPVRQSMAVIELAEMFIGLEGLLMHVAKAVNTPAVIIYGGFIHPRNSGYKGHLHIYNPIHCSPCANTTRHHKNCKTMECMKGISPEAVFEQIRKWAMDRSKILG